MSSPILYPPLDLVHTRISIVKLLALKVALSCARTLAAPIRSNTSQLQAAESLYVNLLINWSDKDWPGESPAIQEFTSDILLIFYLFSHISQRA